MFTTRMRDTAFKRSLRKVPISTRVKIDPPMGSFTQIRARGQADWKSYLEWSGERR
jgi:hypothetical protein